MKPLSFSDVKPEQLFGPASDGFLAQRVASQNLPRYRELRTEYDYIIGMKKRPDSYYK